MVRAGVEDNSIDIRTYAYVEGLWTMEGSTSRQYKTVMVAMRIFKINSVQ